MSISTRKRFLVLQRDHFRCVYCGRGPDHGVFLHVDHIHPVSLGGTDELENLTTACSECNLGKSDLTLIDAQASPVISLVDQYTCGEWFADEAEARRYGVDHAGECGAPATYIVHIEGYGSCPVCERHIRFYAENIRYRIDSIPLPRA